MSMTTKEVNAALLEAEKQIELTVVRELNKLFGLGIYIDDISVGFDFITKLDDTRDLTSVNCDLTANWRAML